MTSAVAASSPLEAIDHGGNRFDFLRLLAAWLVLFSHCYALGGWPDAEPLATTLGIDTVGGIGVAIFFVLSGYLVTLSLERCPSLLVFARRRALRIYPALFVACLLCVVLAGFWVSRLDWQVFFSQRETWQYLRSATAWKIQFVLPGVFENNPYPGAVNGSLWSLPYELRCYIALALLSLLPLSLRWKTLMALLFLMAVILLRPTIPPAAAHESFLGLDYVASKLGFLFALGAVFASWRAWIHPRGWLGLPLMVLAFFVPHGGWQLLAFFGGFGMLTLWLALAGRWLPAIPKRMGDWSYGTYLYGFPVQQWLAFQGWHEHGLLVFIVASTLLTLLLAALSWFLVEKPALRWK